MSERTSKKTPKEGEKEKRIEKVENAERSGFCGTCFRILLAVFVVLMLGLWLLPSPIEPIAYSYPEPLPVLEGVMAPNDKLRKSERLFQDKLIGPESLAFDNSGVLHTGLADGRIVKIVNDEIVEVVRTGKASPCGLPEQEPDCGRPLGMRFDRYGSNLFVADAYGGLLQVNPKARTVSTVVPSKPGINGVPMMFINDLDIARDGTIYFTDSSTKWQRRYNRYCILEGDNTGRLMAYYPRSGEVEVLVDNLQFANGVQLSPEGDFLLVVETTRARVMKYHLKGDHEGHLEVFAENLPGLPDNIRPSSRGGYWVGMGTARKAPFAVLDFLAPHPWIRKLITKLIPQEWIVKLVPKYGLVIELSEEGNIKTSLHDVGGTVISEVSEVHDEDGVLFFGSYRAPYLGKLKL